MFVPLLLLAIALVSLPVDVYQQHVMRAYGLSVQGWGVVARRLGEGTARDLGDRGADGARPLRDRAAQPQRWWFYFWLLTVPVVVLLVFVTPVVLDPLFNTFEPLETTQPQLVEPIERVAERGGLEIARSRLFEMKASEKVTTYNAYVTGLGATKRVVVWDNTARDLSIPRPSSSSATSWATTCSATSTRRSRSPWWSCSAASGWGAGSCRGSSRAGATAGACADSTTGPRCPYSSSRSRSDLFLATPILSAFSRYCEHQADVYGLEVTHGLIPDSAQVAASTFQNLGEKGLAYPTPNPLLVFWTYGHPPIADRIEFSLGYDPWSAEPGPAYVR